MALALSSTYRAGSIPSSTQLAALDRQRRQIAPLSVSRPDGSATAVAAPQPARVPTGTMYQAPQQIATAPRPTPASMGAAPSGPPAPGTPAGFAPANSTLINSRSNPYGPPGTPPPAGPPSVPGAQTSTLTGQEQPYRVLPGQSGTADLQASARTAAQRALDNPSPFDDDLFKQEVARGQEAIGGDIAARGLDYSSLAPQIFSTKVLQPLLSERARGIADARRQALEGAQSVVGQQTGLETGAREELRGERGYTDQLREQARQNALQEYQVNQGSLQQTLAQALASGDPSQALAALQRAQSGYSDQASGTADDLSQLAQLFAQQFYGS